jgi:hypothetical protein
MSDRADFFARVHSDSADQDRRAAIDRPEDLLEEISYKAFQVEIGDEEPPKQRILDRWASAPERALRVLRQS